jgi:hypothetical protein
MLRDVTVAVAVPWIAYNTGMRERSPRPQRRHPMTKFQAIRTLLTADLRAFPLAWEALNYAYKGRPPIRLIEFAEAIDAAYLSGF